MPYRLKTIHNSFQCCGGPFEGRKFEPGKTYAEIPQEEAWKFDEVKTEKTSQVTSHRSQAEEEPKVTSHKAQTEEDPQVTSRKSRMTSNNKEQAEQPPREE